MKRYEWRFIATGCALTIFFFIIVNYITKTQYPWFIYPTLLLLLLPLGLYCIFEKKHTLFSLVGSFLILLYLVTENYLNTPDYPWVLYAVAPIVLWPVLILLGKRNNSMFVACTISTFFILYYVILNIYLAPPYPWAIFPAFAILWWPLSLYHVKRKSYFAFSVSAAIFISLFFISVNVFFSPRTIWAVYPAFAVLWWPLSMYYYYYRRKVDY
ncbi:hypothetical protein D8M04_13100 [Oceanobacillus piezotolerans]|uniref:Uncharacterized protein n=1 Tax=Oceanobacillus piezotolerans TaxID=2448030 RepID=A0A498D7H9_9BACI|nr:hypothetical protein D8M04_13100 [Oceanobacillus piezotolerans]